MEKIAIFWFRRDLRLQDNAGLYHALRSGLPVLPLFIFDTNILDKLESKLDARVTFIYDTLCALQQELAMHGSAMLVEYGDPQQIWVALLKKYPIAAVYTNHDFEPYAIQRDEAVRQLLQVSGVAFHTFKDHVIFEKDEVLKEDGKPYTVFTPYSRKWRSLLMSKVVNRVNDDGQTESQSYYLQSYPSEQYAAYFYKTPPLPPMRTLQSMGFERTDLHIPPRTVGQSRIKNYDKTRDIPAIEGTSRLGIHFRFGTISIRQKAWRAQQLNDVFLSELIWRDFYAMILAHFPHVAGGAFRPEYDRITWLNDEHDFQRWCTGTTGYPLVDAGMRELNATGYMHNRVRMVTASFLTKHLLIDWRLGEAYFAAKLLDFDLASNNGGWQWAAGSGTDAAPYFRIFNPTAQQEKFDPQATYIKRWIPEYGTSAYPTPIVDHKMARERCLAAYKRALSK